MEFLGFTIETIGKLLVAYTAIAVHYRVWREHKVDDKVFHAMRREMMLGVIGAVLILVGYIIQIPFIL